MLQTQVRPSRDLRNHYSDVVRSLKQYGHVIITNNGVGESVLINMEMYAEFEKFLHHRYIYEELQKSKASLDNPNVKMTDAADMFSKIEQKLESKGL